MVRLVFRLSVQFALLCIEKDRRMPGIVPEPVFISRAYSWQVDIVHFNAENWVVVKWAFLS